MEVWKDIEGYEHTHEVSNYGNVRNKVTGRILCQGSGKRGHKHIGIRANQITRDFLVHRLVAMAFIQNPHNYPVVNHKDENPSNNCVENLEWCTHKYNLNYGNAQRRRSHQVSQYDLSGNLIRIWISSMECHKAGYNHGAIWACCRNAFNSEGNNIYRNSIWKYTDRKIKQKTKKSMQSLSFNKGLREVDHGKITTIRKELMNALGIATRFGWYNRRDGKNKTMTVTDKDVIERIFRAYGVTNPWGE